MDTKVNNRIYTPVAKIIPGVSLLELLESFNMTQKELAERIGRPVKLINEIVKGKASITPETAIQLEQVFDKSASFWLNLESDYQRQVVQNEIDDKLEDEFECLTKYPFSQMVSFGWVSNVTGQVEKVKELLKFFGVGSLKNVVESKQVEPVLYKVSTKKKVDSYGLAAWLRKGILDAQKIETKPFSAELLEKNIQKLRSLNLKEPGVFLEQVKMILSDCGVAFAVNKTPINVPVNGAARWIGLDKALVHLTIYGADADKFWFSLFHEIGHVLMHGKKSINIDLNNQNATDKNEAEANDFAKDILIPRADYLNFINSTEVITANSINSFANKIGVLPGIVVGRLQFEGVIGFNQFNKLRRKYKWN